MAAGAKRWCVKESAGSDVSLPDLLGEMDGLLQPGLFSDYCPNGLQIEGRARVARLVSGVSACRALIEAAVERAADAVLVHHGYFWRNESPTLTGMRRERVRLLMENDISLICYHLPLDVHPQIGNNARLAERLGLSVESDLPGLQPAGIVKLGRLPEALDPGAFRGRLARSLGRDPLHIAAGPARISRVAWCTGAGQAYLENAVAAGVDAFITGEVSEPTVHVARENGVHFFAAGHHATERYGVAALGDRMAAHFGIWHEFVDIENPV
jgi:dinuclear metal center YbgI/SA1388 family protein